MGGENEPSASVRVDTGIGTIAVAASDLGLRRVFLPMRAAQIREAAAGGAAEDHARTAADQIAEYVAGERQRFELELDWAGADERHRTVLETLCTAAPFGSVVTYGGLARAIGEIDARAIGRLMATNPLPLVVPCHRVVAASGLGGYGGGLDLKRRLLELEGVLPRRLAPV